MGKGEKGNRKWGDRKTEIRKPDIV